MNNQFKEVAMSLQNIKTPIDPNTFVKQFEEKFQKWGNTITKELKKTWKQNCLVFNNVIANKDKAIKYIVSAPTGSAKTENMITYCAMLPKEIKVLISTNLTDEVDRLAQAINDESGEDRACAFHSKNKFTINEASKYQVIVATHAFYKSHSTKTVKWKTEVGSRDLLVIDEALTTLKEISLTLNRVTIAFNFFEALRRENITFDMGNVFNEETLSHEKNDNLLYERELASLVRELNELSKILDSPQTGTYLERSDTTIDIAEEGERPCIIKQFTLPILYKFEKLLHENTLKCNKILTGIDDESNDLAIQNNILETLKDISSIREKRAYVTANQGIKSLNAVIDYLPRQSLVCLDATADINQTYALREKHHKDLVRVPKIENVRDYSTVTLHYTPILTSKKHYVKTVYESFLKDIQFGSKTLFVIHKRNIEIFNKILEENYSEYETDIASWGSLTGLNNWKDYDTCVLLGLNHKPRHFIQNRALANTNEHIAFGDLQRKLNIDIEVSDLAAEIVQAINRIRIRNIVSSDGRCKSANIYLTLPTINTSNYLLLIKQHMCNIKTRQWKTDAISSNSTTFEELITYLSMNLQQGGKIKITTPRNELQINSDTYRSVIGKSKKKKNEFKEKLKQYGYGILEINEVDERGRPRSKPTKYIYKLQ